MIELAHNLTLETLPPLAALKVVAEERAVPGRDYFDIGERERLFDTPSTAARIWRSTAGKRKYLLTADGSRSLTAAPLKFRWVLLRGDPQAVEIKPLDEAGSRAEISLKWQPRRPITEGSKMESNRVDIGLLASRASRFHRRFSASTRWITKTANTTTTAGCFPSPTPARMSLAIMSIPPTTCQNLSHNDYRYDEANICSDGTRSRGEKKRNLAPGASQREDG